MFNKYLKDVVESNHQEKNKQLIERILSGDQSDENLIFVRQLMCRGSDPNVLMINNEKKFSITLLHHAILRGFYKLSSLLLEYGADPTLTDKNTGILDFFMSAMQDLKEAKHSFDEKVLKESYINFIQIVRILTDHATRENVDNIKTESGRTLLCCTLLHDQFSIADTLIQIKHANVNSLDSNGDSILRILIKYGSLNSIRYLIGAGADIEAKNKTNDLIYLARSIPRQDVVGLLREMYEEKEKQLIKLTLSGVDSKDDLESIEKLLKEGVSPNIVFEKSAIYSDVLVCEVILRGYYNNASLLLKYGADPTKKGKSIGIIDLLDDKMIYKKGILKAGSYNQIYVEKLKFLAENVDVKYIDKIKTKSGRTLLYCAILYAEFSIADDLINKGANLDIKDDLGNSVLHLAQDIEVVKYLLKQSEVFINSLNQSNNTPLHKATEIKNLEIIRYLVDNGAYVDLVNCDGKRPKDLINDKNIKKILKKGKKWKHNSLTEASITPYMQTSNSFIYNRGPW